MEGGIFIVAEPVNLVAVKKPQNIIKDIHQQKNKKKNGVKNM